VDTARAQGNSNLLLFLQPALMLLSIPLARMDMRWLPSSFLSDYSFGMMSRLGVCFAVVVLLWCWGFSRELFHWRSPVFIVASVISANAAYASDRLVPSRFAMLAIVTVGAILLALSQKLLLDYSWGQMLVASVAAPASFYLVLFSAGLFPKDMQNSIQPYWPYFWQLGYLLGMFVIPDFFQKSSALASGL
jgi:hypothetical protein